VKTSFLILFILLLVMTGCQQSDSITDLQMGGTLLGNLIPNSIFDSSGVPSLQGWIVPDRNAVEFSNDIPPSGLGHTLVLFPARPPENSNPYTIVATQSGTHRYRLSVFGKRKGQDLGGIYASRKSPTSNDISTFAVISVSDTSWTFYSQTVTITTAPHDLIIVSLSGGGAELSVGKTYLNTCRFEKLD
jgi:hypothetical protein